MNTKKLEEWPPSLGKTALLTVQSSVTVNFQTHFTGNLSKCIMTDNQWWRCQIIKTKKKAWYQTFTGTLMEMLSHRHIFVASKSNRQILLCLHLLTYRSYDSASLHEVCGDNRIFKRPRDLIIRWNWLKWYWISCDHLTNSVFWLAPAWKLRWWQLWGWNN